MPQARADFAERARRIDVFERVGQRVRRRREPRLRGRLLRRRRLGFAPARASARIDRTSSAADFVRIGLRDQA